MPQLHVLEIRAAVADDDTMVITLGDSKGDPMATLSILTRAIGIMSKEAFKASAEPESFKASLLQVLGDELELDLWSQLEKTKEHLIELRDKHLLGNAAVVRALTQKRIEALENYL